MRYLGCIKRPSSSVNATHPNINAPSSNPKNGFAFSNEINSGAYSAMRIKNVTTSTTPCNVGTGFLLGTSRHGLSMIFNFLKIHNPTRLNIDANAKTQTNFKTMRY